MLFCRITYRVVYQRNRIFGQSQCFLNFLGIHAGSTGYSAQAFGCTEKIDVLRNKTTVGIRSLYQPAFALGVDFGLIANKHDVERRSADICLLTRLFTMIARDNLYQFVACCIVAVNTLFGNSI